MKWKLLVLEFFGDEFLFGMPQVFQKYMKLTKHPNSRGAFIKYVDNILRIFDHPPPSLTSFKAYVLLLNFI